MRSAWKAAALALLAATIAGSATLEPRWCSE
jgi:hypothetical protein